MSNKSLEPINTDLIQPVDFPENKYYPIECKKTMVVLHHTVSGPGVRGDIDHWLSLADRIATCIIIDDKGVPFQCFSSKYWAHHLGVKSTYLKANGYSDWSTRNVELNRASIAIEIDNWGGLFLGDGSVKKFGEKTILTAKGKFYTFYGNIVDVEMQEYPQSFRENKYYQKYNEAQLKTVGELLLLWNQRYGIPLDYNSDMWDVSKNALGGKSGVWTHVSFRGDKSDCHPQPELIEMLKSLK